jgi:hypothetical protein
MKTLLRLLLKSQHQRNRSEPAQTDKGMTLVELLVGSIMAFLIITPMLAFVVDMLNTDRREQVKSNTEQDLQAAVDFISQDLSQAIYIYNGKEIGVIKPELPAPPDASPILVFWKRQQIKKAVPINEKISIKPNKCGDTANADKCNDTYVLSLVAYYQFKDNDPTWCQPSGAPCPTRIARYEIRERLRDPYATDATKPYYEDADLIDSQKGSAAFNKDFDFSKPTVKVTTGANLPQNHDVLVNYIDHSKANVPDPPDCKTTLGVTDPPPPAPALTQKDLLTADGETNSFYACVDTARNIARVTIRGNSLRRLQPNDTDYKAEKAAYFPTASVQVQGLGGLGK